MKRIVLITGLVFFLFTGVAFAAAPTWTPITGTSYAMLNYGEIHLDGTLTTWDTSYIIAAFGPGGETDCRAKAEVSNLTSQTKPGYYYLTLVSNKTDGEVITYKVYDSTADKIYDVQTTLDFIDGGGGGKCLH